MATNPAAPSVDSRVLDFAIDPITVGRWSLHPHSNFVIVDGAGRSLVKIANANPHADVVRAAVLALPALVASLEALDDLCPRMSDDDPIAPAIRDAVRSGRAALAEIRKAQRGGV